MKKKLLLVGMINRQEAFEFMNAILGELSKRSVDITYIDHNRVRFETPHTEVWFIWSSLHMRNLEGIRADGIFGHNVTEQMLWRATNDAVISNRDHIGLVDHICKVEIDAKCDEAIARGTTYITTAGQEESEFFKRMLNYTYGKFPERPPVVYLDTDIFPKVEFMLGRRNGKTQACVEYMKKLIERGEINMPTKEEVSYIRKDAENTARLYAAMRDVQDRNNRRKLPGIKNVIFSGPCTIVLWEDGTKTIVRCDKDVLDPEKGLAMAIAKKALGTNKSGSNYYDIFKKWLPKEDPMVIDFEEAQNG